MVIIINVTIYISWCWSLWCLEEKVILRCWWNYSSVAEGCLNILLSLREVIGLSLFPLAILVGNLSKNYHFECMGKGSHLVSNRPCLQIYMNFWNCFELITFHVFLQNQVAVGKKIMEGENYISHFCRGYIFQLCLVKCSARHIHLVHKSLKTFIFLNWISVAALIFLQSLLFPLVMMRYSCFPSLKHCLFLFFPSIVR